MLDIAFYGKYRRYLRSVPDDFCLEFRVSIKERDLSVYLGILTVRPEVPAHDVMHVHSNSPCSGERLLWDVRAARESEEGTSLVLELAKVADILNPYEEEITLRIPEDARVLQHIRYAFPRPRVVYLYVGGFLSPKSREELNKDTAEHRIEVLAPVNIGKFYMRNTRVGLAREPSIDGNGATMRTACIASLSDYRRFLGDDIQSYTGTITFDKDTGQILSRQPPKYSYKTLQDTLRNNQEYKENVDRVTNQYSGVCKILFKVNGPPLAPQFNSVTLLEDGNLFGAGPTEVDLDFLHPLESVYTLNQPYAPGNGYFQPLFTVPMDSNSLDENQIVRRILQERLGFKIQ